MLPLGNCCTLSSSVNDTKRNDTDDVLEGRDSTQRDLDRLERWTCANNRRFNNVKGKVLHLGWGNPEHRYRLGNEWIENSPVEKHLGVLVNEKP